MKYDIIIVGAGSAGCVLAARLSEDRSRSVLLLEAGPDYPDLEQTPQEIKYGINSNSAVVSAPTNPHNWAFWGTATPQRPDPMPVPRGKAVGGSSAINGQTFLRGIPEDYDNWASWGNDQWGYLKVLPYFRRMETDLDIHDDFHGSEGPIPVRRPKRENWPPLVEAFYRACVAAGFPEDPDMHNPDTLGVAPIPLNHHDGIRMSTAITYLNPSRHSLNLTIRPNILVRRIIFTGNQATAVEVESGSERFIVEGEEIILSAGAIASPQLLMLSGIGPADHLSSLGIQLVRDLPGVGQNLRDHPMVTLRVRVKEGFRLDPDSLPPKVCLRYTASGSNARSDLQIQPSYSQVLPGGDPGEAEIVRFSCTLEQSVGAGELLLTSTDPKVQPHLEYRYLANPWDRERMRENVRLCLQLFEQEAFGGIIEEKLSPTDKDLASDQALDAWLLRNATTSQHSSATCKMGPHSDPMAVVDQYCLVHGLNGLRVVDASVMPDVIRANTNATTIMIAERVADWIK